MRHGAKVGALMAMVVMFLGALLYMRANALGGLSTVLVAILLALCTVYTVETITKGDK